MKPGEKTIIVVCGPTAVGKTALAIQLATELETEIISADSRQCFTELNIGVAKPSTEELSLIPHHFINSHSIHQTVDAIVFEQYALAKAHQLFQTHDTIVMVGGTGLYIKAFVHGLDELPPVDQTIRERIQADYEAHGLAYLQQQVQTHDPAYWSVGEQQNPRRLMRALEVVLSTGSSITSFQKGNKQHREFRVVQVGLELPRDQLYNRINQRVDTMMEDGLLQEVEALLPYQNLNALQTVGYRELFPVLEGNQQLEAAVAQLKTNTRHYAKRQLTWFKKDPEIHWFDAGNTGLVSRILELV